MRLPPLLKAALTATALFVAPFGADAATKVVISQAFQSALYLPFYVALDEGFFAKQGLDVVKETAGAPSIALAAVLSGSAQFSIHGPEWTAIAASKGAPVQIVANVVNGAAVWIATTPDFKFSSVKDLKGLPVVTGTMPTTSTSLFIKLLKENGMDAEKDVQMIQVPIGSEPGPFAAGQAKVAVMYEPGLDQMVAKGMKVVLGFPELYGPYAFSAVTAKKDVDPAVAQAVVNAMEMAFRFMQKDQAKTIEIAKKEFPTLDPLVIEATVKRLLASGAFPAHVDISPAALKTGMETQIALGNLKQQPSYDAFVGTVYIDKALKLP